MIGTPFDDYIVGTPAAETFYGGGGADLIVGGGGADVAYGGAEGDGCIVPVSHECEFSGEKIEPRDPGTESAGAMASQSSSGPALYFSGTDGADDVVASYSSGQVAFSLNGNPAETFAVPEPPDSILLAGNAGDDTLTASQGFPASTSVVLLGGEGNDHLNGGETEDALVDGAGNDIVSAGGGDDALPNNGGADDLAAGSGDDLFISNAVCDGDTLDGGSGRDNANWANFESRSRSTWRHGAAGLVGGRRPAELPERSVATPLIGLEDIEGTSLGRHMVGDSGSTTSCSAATGADTYLAGAGKTRSSPTPAPPGPIPTRSSIAAKASTPPRSTCRKTDPTPPRSTARSSTNATPTASARPTPRPTPPRPRSLPSRRR